MFEQDTPQGVDWNLNTALYLPRTNGASVFVPVSLLELRQINRREELAAINVNLSSLLQTPGGRLTEDEAQNIFTPEVLELRQNNPTQPKNDETADLVPANIVEFPNAAKRAERSRLQRILPRAVAAAVVGLATTLYPVIENGLAQAQSMLFSNPLPKQGNNVEGTSLSSKVLKSNYRILKLKMSPDGELAAVVQLPEDNIKRVVKREIDQTGTPRLNEIGQVSFPTVNDIGISEKNPQTGKSNIIVVGEDNGQGRLIGSTDEVRWQFARDDRGPFLSVLIPPNSDEAYVSRGDPRAENYPGFLEGYNYLTNALREMAICSGCAANGLPGKINPATSGVFIGASNADPRGGILLKTIDATGVISAVVKSPELGYVWDNPESFIDSQGMLNVLPFTNFGYGLPPNNPPVFGIATFWKDRFNPNNNYAFVDRVTDQPRYSLYTSNAGVRISRLIRDVSADKLFMATFAQNFLTHGFAQSAFIESADTHQLWANDGAWINQRGSDFIEHRGGGISDKGGNKKMIIGLERSIWLYDQVTNSNYLQFEEGRVVEKDMRLNEQWRWLVLWANQEYRAYLSVIFKN